MNQNQNTKITTHYYPNFNKELHQKPAVQNVNKERARISASSSPQDLRTASENSRVHNFNPPDFHLDDLLRYVLEMKFLTIPLITRKFPELAEAEKRKNKQALPANLNPEGQQITLINRAIKQLCLEGYLKCKDPVLTDQSLLFATSKSYETLKSKFQDKDIAQPITKHFPFGIEHDLQLTKLRIKFEELNFLDRWISERTLEEIPFMRQTFQKLPDAVCKKKNNKGYFLELERSKKSKKEYEARINEYKEILKKEEIANAGIEGVVFVCTDPEVQETIRSILPATKQFSCLPINRYLSEDFYPSRSSEAQSAGQNPRVLGSEVLPLRTDTSQPFGNT